MAKKSKQWANKITGYGEEDPTQLLANSHNYRIHPKFQQDALSGVLNEVGWVDDVIVNRRTSEEWGADRGVETVLDGHLRVSLAISRDEPTVPVKYVDLTPDEEALILATFDPIGALAVADAEVLADLLAQVRTEDEAVQRLLDEVASEAGIAIGDEPGHRIGDSGRLYAGHDVEPHKLAYRIEAAWRAEGRLALDLFSGEGQLAGWYRRRFDRVITVDRDSHHNVDYVMEAADFIDQHLNAHMDFDFVDFDDERTPAREIQAFFDHIGGRKENPFILALTDGQGLNLKLRGRYNPAVYLAGPDRVCQATVRDYLAFEELVQSFMEKVATGAGFKPAMLSSHRGREGDVVYQTWLMGR